jgi:hypothetical protein
LIGARQDTLSNGSSHEKEPGCPRDPLGRIVPSRRKYSFSLRAGKARSS